MTKEMTKHATAAAVAFAFCGLFAQEIVPCGAGSYASYTPWAKARTADGKRRGDQSRFMQNRPVYMTARRKGEPIPTNDWWTDALVSRWTGKLWSYPAKVRIGQDGVRVANPSRWIDNGTEMKERSAVVVGAAGNFAPEATLVDDWHDWDVEMLLADDGGREIRTTLVHGSPFTWVEAKGVELAVSVENDAGADVKREKRGGGEVISVGEESYGVWRGGPKDAQWIAVAVLPSADAFDKLAPYARAVVRSTRVDWKYDEPKAVLTTTWNVETEDLAGKEKNPVALQGFQPHHLKRTHPGFKTVDGLVWNTPRGKQRVAAGNSLSVAYDFPGMLPYWAAPEARGSEKYDAALFRDLISDYANRGSFGGDTYWGGKGLLQMAFAMMAARETGDEKSFRDAHAKLRAKFEDWLTWTPGEQRFYFSYVPKWGGLVGEDTSYDSDAFNDHHFHYGYFTYSGALLCMVDDDFRKKFGPMLTMIAKDYANWDRTEKRFPLFRTFDPWAGHSFAGGVGDGAGNGQESSSEAMQGWGGLYLLGLALGDDAMRDAGIFGYVSEARATAEYWFDRDRENIDYTKYKHPYNSNLTCHGVGWWTYFSGDPVWMHSIQWLPNTPALDYLSEDLKFAKWDWETMWKTKEIGGWFEKGRTRDGHETPPVGNESLGNVLLSYLQRHDPAQAAEVFDNLRAKKMNAAMNADTAHMTYWATHSHIAWGELDFGVRADYPCARAFVKNGKRTLMAYNCGDRPRKVRFFAADGKSVGEIDAAPHCLTVQGLKSAGVPKFDFPAPADKVSQDIVIESEKTVLKEGEPCRLSARVRRGGKFTPCKAEWSSSDGEFDGDEFTPRGNGFATVEAKANGLSVSRRLPVEEALVARKLAYSPANISAIVGEGVKMSVSCEDQFGGKMSLKGSKTSVTAPSGKPAVAGKDYKTAKGGIFIPLAKGTYVLRTEFGGMSAESRIEACAIGEVNLARLAAITASGEENGGLLAAYAADGDMKTRWSSRHRDGEWICFDFGKERTVSKVEIDWENARAEHYVVEVSDDGATWRRVAEKPKPEGKHEMLSWPAVKARRLRIVGLKRNTPYGISIFELAIR